MTDMDGLVYEVARRWTAAVQRGDEIETLDSDAMKSAPWQ
jgi:hypothetical protein